MTFAEKLKELREKAKLTQVQLADKAGIPVGTLRNHEQENRNPSVPHLFQLADALNVSLDEFKDCELVANPGRPQYTGGKGRRKKEVTNKTHGRP